MQLIFIFVFNILGTFCEYYEVTDRVSFDIKIDNAKKQSIVLGLFRKDAPKTVVNFLKIVKYGVNGKSYNGTKIIIIRKRSFLLGGDIVHNNGSGYLSVYGDAFEMESNHINYTVPGFISMLNNGKNQSGCQFFINFRPLPYLNQLHTIFGKVIENQQTIHYLELLKTTMFDTPKNIVIIDNVHIIPTKSSFYISDETYNLWIWLKNAWIPLSFQIGVLILFMWMLRQLKT